MKSNKLPKCEHVRCKLCYARSSTCYKNFFRSNISVSPSRTFVSYIGRSQSTSILKNAPNLEDNVTNLQKIIPKRFFSQTSILKSRWKPIFNEETTNRYVRLNRFQQYQQQRSGGNPLGSMTILGLSLMAGIYFGSLICSSTFHPLRILRRIQRIWYTRY